MKKFKLFKFSFITKLQNGQEFINGHRYISALNYDLAEKELHKKEIPFCTVITTQIIK
jgi:hypothetical protein